MTYITQGSESRYGEMYTVDNSTASTINSSTEWHGVYNDISEGETSGFTYLAGEAFGITDVSNDGTYVTFVTSAQTLLANQYVALQGTTLMDGIWKIYDRADATHFRVESALAGSEAAITAWGQRGTSLTVDSGSDGLHQGSWTSSGISETNAHVFDFAPVLNDTIATKAKARRKFSNLDYGSFSGQALVNLVAGDVIWFAIQNVGATGNVTLRTRDQAIVRI